MDAIHHSKPRYRDDFVFRFYAITRRSPVERLLFCFFLDCVFTVNVDVVVVVAAVHRRADRDRSTGVDDLSSVFQDGRDPSFECSSTLEIRLVMKNDDELGTKGTVSIDQSRSSTGVPAVGLCVSVLQDGRKPFSFIEQKKNKKEEKIAKTTLEGRRKRGKFFFSIG